MALPTSSHESMRLAALPLGLAVALLVVAWVAAMAGHERAGATQQVCTTSGGGTGQPAPTVDGCAGPDADRDVREAATGAAPLGAGATGTGPAVAAQDIAPDRSDEIADAISTSAFADGADGADSTRMTSAGTNRAGEDAYIAEAITREGDANAAPDTAEADTADEDASPPTTGSSARAAAASATRVPTRSTGVAPTTTVTPGPAASAEPTVRALPAIAVTPTPAPTVRPAATPTARPTATPTVRPAATPTARPTATPTVRPAATPTAAPTAVPAPTGPQPVGQDGAWRLIFEDNFDYLDTLTWEPAWFGRSDFARPVNDRDAACIHPKQVSVVGGQLNLTVSEETDPRCLRKDGVTQADYVAGLVNTRESFTFSYGYAEARIYLPSSGGRLHNWPAFWHTGFNWPYTGEIDIAEGLSNGQPCAVHHYASGGQHLQSKRCMNWAEPGGWHVFAADWRPDGITYYYDGVEVFSTSEGVTGDPHYLVINFAVNEAVGAVAPSTMAVDYVRVWQR